MHLSPPPTTSQRTDPCTDPYTDPCMAQLAHQPKPKSDPPPTEGCSHYMILLLSIDQ